MGEDILLGVLLEEISGVSTQTLYEIIKANKSISEIPSSELGYFRNAAKSFDLEKLLTTPKILKRVCKYRPDLVSIIENHPGGIKWLESQISNVKTQLSPTNTDIGVGKWTMKPETVFSK